MGKGYIRVLGQWYADGVERMEIHVPKAEADDLPCQEGTRVPVRLRVGDEVHHAGLRMTQRNQYVWISPDLRDQQERRVARLVDVLSRNGFRKNQRVRLVHSENELTVLPMQDSGSHDAEIGAGENGKGEVVPVARSEPDRQMPSVDEAKSRYMDDEIWLLTFNGAFGRANVYNREASTKAKEEFRYATKEYVRNLVRTKYAEGAVDSEEHLREIIELRDWASSNYGHLLRDGRLRLGVAQKLLNLYLKYLWCSGIIPEPPHCPFDRTIIERLGRYGMNWTDLDTEVDYQQLVKAAKTATGGQCSVAVWELVEFRRRTGLKQLHNGVS